MKVNKIWVLGVSLLLAAVSSRGADAAKVALVKAGELKEARASWWGFDKADSTAFLQAAIDSGVPKLIVDHTGEPWISDQLRCVSNQEIVFERGVEVVAKRGVFKGRNDSLINMIGVENVVLRGPGATLRMQRADYDAAPYAKAEWRHVVNMRGCTNVKILGLTLAESGGDGIYLGIGSGRRTNLNIEIRDVICDRNYRQGISVITAENLLIENTIMRDTAGAPPAAGIDFEPNQRGERLKNCVMRNCLTQNNQGDGYVFYLPNLLGSSEPVSIEIINCRSVGDCTAVRLVTANNSEDAVKGFLRLENCTFSDSSRYGVSMASKPVHGMTFELKNCVVENCGISDKVEYTDVLFASSLRDDLPPGGVKFDNLVIRQPKKRKWVEWQSNAVYNGTLTNLSGVVTVESAGSKERIELDDAWCAKTFPPRFTVHVPRVKSDLTKARFVTVVEGMRKLAHVRLRKGGSYLFYAEAGKEVVLQGRQSKVGRSDPARRPLLVKNLADKVLKSTPMPQEFNSVAEVRFTPKESGFYKLEVTVGRNAFALLQANVPVAFDTSVRGVELISSVGPLYAVVPVGTGLFAFGVAGEGNAERVKATVSDPNGKAVWSQASIASMERYVAEDGEGAAGGIWQIEFARPETGVFEDFYVDLLGVPAFLFLDDKSYWTF